MDHKLKHALISVRIVSNCSSCTRGLVIRISEFQFFAHSKDSGMNKLRFFYFTEYDILQINIFVTIF